MSKLDSGSNSSKGSNRKGRGNQAQSILQQCIQEGGNEYILNNIVYYIVYDMQI